MSLADDVAEVRLRTALKVPGLLRIITADLRPELRGVAGVDLKDPASFVCHDVVRLDGPDDRGRLKARSAEGDWTAGRAAALLARLTEASLRG